MIHNLWVPGSTLDNSSHTLYRLCKVMKTSMIQFSEY